jgi:hypothetical protein
MPPKMDNKTIMKNGLKNITQNKGHSNWFTPKPQENAR